jgi:hypothetical protein
MNETSVPGLGLIIIGIIILTYAYGKKILELDVFSRLGISSIVLGLVVWVMAEICEHRNT